MLIFVLNKSHNLTKQLWIQSLRITHSNCIIFACGKSTALLGISICTMKTDRRFSGLRWEESVDFTTLGVQSAFAAVNNIF